MSWGGYIVLPGIVIYFLSLHGSEWEFGRYCMPRSLVNETGVEFRNGAKIDGITLALVKADNEEEMYLAFLGVLVGILAGASALIYRDYRRHEKRMAALRDRYR
jgi:hypothetical protein